MASFTDAITQFTPYQPEAPVEALAKVGLWKQQQYDAGVQKIQDEFTSVAGMPIAKEPVKNYLQTKLDDVKKQVSSGIATDFSNQRLVNHVTSLTKQVGADPIVQLGVQNTLALQKGYKDIEDSKQVGKDGNSRWGKNNEDYFNSKAVEWLNDGKLDSPFNTQYTPHVDVDGRIRKLGNDLKDNGYITEIPYQRDNAGNTLYFDKSGKASTNPANGQPKVDDAILKVTYKGVGAQRLLGAFYDGLTAEDEQQLHIDSWAHYRGATSETFVNDINNKYDLQKKNLLDHYSQIGNQLNDPKLSSVQKAALQSELNNTISSLTTGIEKDRQQDLNDLSLNNIDEYKYKLYTQNYLLGMSRDLAHEEKDYEIKSNPYAEMALGRQRLNAEYDRMRMDDRHFNMKFAQDAGQFEANYRLKLKELGIGQEPITQDNGIRTDLPIPTIETLQQKVNTTQQQLQELDSRYAPSMVQGYDKIVKSNLSTEEKTKAIKGSLDDQFNNYLKNPNSVTDNKLKTYFDTRNALELDMHTKQNMQKNITEQANNKFNDKIGEVLKGVVGLKSGSGDEFYTAEQFIDANSKFNKYYSVSNSPGGGGLMGGGGGNTMTVLDTKSLLSDFKGTKYQNLAVAVAKNYTGEPLTPTEKTILARYKDLSNTYKAGVSSAVDERNNFISSEIMKSLPEYRVRSGTLNPLKNPQEAHQLNSLIGNSINAYNNGQLPLENSSDFDPDKLTEWTTGKTKEAVDYVLNKNYDGSGSLIVQLGKDKMTIPISNLSQYFPEYSANDPFDNMKEIIKSHPYRSTNINQAEDPVNAYIQGNQLPTLRNYPAISSKVRADVEENPYTEGQYQVRLYYFDGKTWIPGVISGGWKNEAEIGDVLNNIGPKTITDFLNRNK